MTNPDGDTEPGPEDDPNSGDGGGNDGDGGDDGGNDQPSPTSLSGMTKAELLAYAEENGVQGVSNSNTKAEILNAIRG